MLKDPIVLFSRKRNKIGIPPLTNYILAEFRIIYTEETPHRAIRRVNLMTRKFQPRGRKKFGSRVTN